MKKYSILFMLSWILASCGIYGKFQPIFDPNAPIADSVASDILYPIGGTPSNILTWRSFFTDAPLQALIDSALANNHDLRIAHEHVMQAEAALRGAQLAYLPSVALVPSAGFSPQYGIANGTYDLVASASWEIDIFGRTLNSLRKAKAAKQQVLDYEQAARCGLIAGVANTYYTLLMLDAQLNVAKQTEQTWSKTVRTIQQMKTAGMANEAAVAQLEATYFAIQTTVLDLQQSIYEVENALCLMLGTTRQPIIRSTLEEVSLASLPFASHLSPINCQLLYNRPDVRAAQMNMAQAHYATNLARSNCLPSLNLSGVFGWTNHNNGVIIDPMTMISSLAASLFAPLFNSGRNIAQIKMAKSQQEEARLQFAKTVLAAGNEVNDALTQYQTCSAKCGLYAQQVQSLQHAQMATQRLMQFGTTTYLEVLTAQNNLLTAQLTQIANQTQQLQALVSLYHALGGGRETNVQ